ncbi:SulP family sulfate permease [Actinocorallia herbida]|uniref:SulP family sulfate permease n=1 Tax=Actinocorallia herbida TaxID=58109 RepID=A0A3N1D2E3_9ACTN|nr:SulP family inorganic anion transporter [Actinocorallia herbida]ROO87707.1 SulP family sulfate permease [Actinocorallia herbida]
MALPGYVTLRRYRRRWLRGDVLAALSLWAVVIPQGFAYAQLAGLPAQAGLYTAFGAMLGYAVLGPTRGLNVGPESSVAIVVASVSASLAGTDPARHVAVASMLAFMVACWLLVGYLVRASVLMRLLSTPVLTGYLAGSALIIVLSQLGKVTGIDAGTGHALVKGVRVLTCLGDVSWPAVACAGLTALVLLVLRRFAPRLPGPLIALALATGIVALAGLDDVLSVLGTVPGGLPLPHLPDVGASDVVALLGPSASIALLVYAGTVLTSRALEAAKGRDADARQEFLGLGAASAVSGLFGGFPPNGSTSRSMLLASSGARTQLAGVVAAGAVALTSAALLPLVRDLPHAALGALIIVTAVGLFDVAEFRRLWRLRRSDLVMAAVTAAGVLVLGVLAGIVVGVVVSLLEVLRRSIMPYTAVLGRTGESEAYRDITNFTDAETLPGLVVYRFDAPLYFANADTLREDLRRLVQEADPPVRLVVVNAEAMYDMDTTGVEVLHRVLDDLEEYGTRLALARVRTPLRTLLRETGLEERIGADHLHLRVIDAVNSFRRGNIA